MKSGETRQIVQRQLQVLIILFIIISSFIVPSNHTMAQSTQAVGDCGPMDVAFVIDNSTSMGGSLNNVKSELSSVLDDLTAAARQNFRLALVTFNTGIDVRVEFSQNNRLDFEQKFNQVVLFGGGFYEPEPSDEALNTVINTLGPSGRLQDKAFTTPFRKDAMKLIVLVTDARPGGFDDAYTPGLDDLNAHTRAIEAAQDRITISSIFVPTSFDPSAHPTVRTIMKDYANTTSGVFTETPATGIGTAEGIRQIIAKCGLGITDGDSDGLPDDWETQGIPGVPLHDMGADPLVKDVFVQVVWMQGQKPDEIAIKTVVDAFKKAPSRINLHVDVGPDSIDYVTGKQWGSYGKGYEIPRIDVLGGQNTLDQDINTLITNSSSKLQSARVFHYAMFIHKFSVNGNTGYSGLSLNFANATTLRQLFFVALGSFTNGRGTINEQAGTFMHELGHSLGLKHGGGDEDQYKPNYLSVMNYSFQMHGIIISGQDGNFDYSRSALAALDENMLVEGAGLGITDAKTYGTRYAFSFPWMCPLKGILPISLTSFLTTLNNANNQVDWNCNGSITSSSEGTISADINSDGKKTKLVGYNDWDSIQFRAGVIGLGLSVDIPPAIVTANDIANAPVEISSAATITWRITLPAVSSP